MPALRAIIGADSDPMRRELEKVKAMADKAARYQENAFNKTKIHGGSGSMRETMVLMRELSRGNWSRVPGSLSILLGQLGIMKMLFRDTASEAKVLAQALEQKAAKSAAAAIAAKRLADASVEGYSAMSKSSAGTILAVAADQQKAATALRAANADREAANAAKANAAAMEAEGGAATLALGPLGLAVAAVIAVGVAAYFTVKHFQKLTEEQKKLADMMDTSTAKMQSQVETLSELADEAERYAYWLEKINDTDQSPNDELEEQLKNMRELAKLQRESAQRHGASPAELAGMDKDEARKELNFVVASKLQLQRQFEQDQSGVDDAVNAKNKFETDNGGIMKDLQGKITEAAAVKQAIEDKMKTSQVIESTGRLRTDPNGVTTMETAARQANANDKFEVNGMPAMSLNEASRNLNLLTGKQDQLKFTRDALGHIVSERERDAEQDKSDLAKMNKKQTELSIAAHAAQSTADGGARMVHGSVNSLQQIGAYAPAAVRLNEGQHEMARHVSSISKAVEKIVQNTTPHPHDRRGGMSDVFFG